MDAAGKDDVLIETVGVGQAEIDIVDHADTIVLALMPGSGDSIQALKAGVMEIPDVIVVNKADHPMTDTMVREVRGVLALSHDPRAGRCRSCAPRPRAARGSRSWREKIDEHRAHIEAAGTLEERRARNLRNEVLGIAASRMRRRLEATAAERPRDPGAARSRGQARARPGQRRLRAAREAGGWLRWHRARCPGRRFEAGSATGRRVGGAAVGQVHGFFVDAASGEPDLAGRPAWAASAAKLVAIPLRDCAGGGGRVWVAHATATRFATPRWSTRPGPSCASTS